jgi:fatty acid amide hydrolase
MTELYEIDAVEMGELLARGETSSADLVEAHITRAEAVDGALNAFVHRFDDQARAEAKDADTERAAGRCKGPLHGVPISIKESLATAGVASTLGLAKRQGQVQSVDAVMVKLLRAAGAIVLGKTNIPQLLLSHESENLIWGAVNNPWNLTRAPGGSSGGESAAIASGMSPWGVGTDIGGSIRVPAAFTGIAGLKPTVDRWSNRGSFTGLVGQEVVRGQCGPMARSARDVATLFGALDPTEMARLDPSVAPVPVGDPTQIDLSGLRVGVFTDDGFITPAASVMRGVNEAAEHLRAAGCEVVAYTPPLAAEIIETYYAALSSDGGLTAKAALAGEVVTPQLNELMRTVLMPGWVRALAASVMHRRGEARVAQVLRQIGEKSVATYWQLAHRRATLRLAALDAWASAGLDAVLCPPHATPAVGHRQSGDFTAAGCYAMRYNFLNLPAGVVPVTRVRDAETQRPAPSGRRADRIDRKAALVEAGTAGLPVGVQIAALPYREDVVLALMTAIETAARAAPEYPRTPVTPPR